MTDEANPQGEVINAQESRGFVNRPSGPVTQYFGKVTINEGASVDEIVEALRKAGVMSLLATRLPEEQFHQLLEIVGRVTLPDTGERLHRACRASLSATAHLVNAEIPALLFADMCEQPMTKAWPPLFECVERFALVQGLDAPLVSDFRLWTDTSAALVTPPTSAEQIERMRQEISADATNAATDDAFSWLQVYLEPDWLNRTEGRKRALFRVELVLSSPKTDGPLVLQSELARTLDDLPTLLDQVFANGETVSLIPEIRRLVIEIVSPSDVLLYGFERWRRDNTVRTYGTEFPLVVRMRDRLAIPNPTDQKRADEYWHEKWNAFRNKVCTMDSKGLAWRAEQDLDAYELQDNKSLACLGLSSPVLPGRREVFDTLRDAGIPIALWMRGSDTGPSAPADLPQRIAALIQGKQLSELHEAIKGLRRSPEARADEANFCNALTLLWDDPDRAPPKYEAQGVYA